MTLTENDESTSARSGHLLLAESAFAELAAGGGSPSVLNELWRGEHTRRLLVLRAVFDAAQKDPDLAGGTAGTGHLTPGHLTPGRLTPVTEAWAALERAEKADPAAFRAMVAHPQVGSWLAYTLRRHEGWAASSAPAYHDLAQLHALAIAAAAATGQAYTAILPLRAGRVMLPRFGMAYFEDCPEWDLADAGTENGRIWLRHGDRHIAVPADGTDAPGWWALRRLSAGQEPRITVWLDDLDPMRDLADPVPPARLPQKDVDRWAELLRDAWTILVRDHRPLAESMAVGVTSLVPLPLGNGWETRSASTGEAFGSIMCSPPPGAVTMAESLAHEFSHIKLGGLMHLFTMTGSATDQWLYAPWRDDPRPAGGLLQGIYAFFAISAFWRVQRRASGVRGEFEYAYARAMTREALEIAVRAGELTERGRMLAAGMAEQMAAWDGDKIDAQGHAVARLVADGHRAGWRIRHCTPRPEDVTVLAAALDHGPRGDVRIGPSSVSPDPEMRHWSGARLGLARRRLLAPERLAQALDEDWGAALTDADLALFAGDAAKAVRGFTEEIENDPTSDDAWTGLGLALQADPDAAARAGRALLSRPELVAAVHRESRTTHSPIEVADLVGAHLA